MSDAKLSMARAETTKYETAVEDEHGNIWSELQNNTNYNWGFSDYGTQDPNCTWCGEHQYAERVLDEIGNSDLMDKEVVILPHDQGDWGYGHNYAFSRDSKEVHVALVYAGGFIPEREVRIMTWHEAAHSWVYAGPDGGEHDTGSGWFSDPKNKFQYLTALTAAYANDSSSNSYMLWEGHGNTPNEFNHYWENHLDNFQGDAQQNHTPVFELDYSSETIGYVDNWL